MNNATRSKCGPQQPPLIVTAHLCRISPHDNEALSSFAKSNCPFTIESDSYVIRVRERSVAVCLKSKEDCPIDICLWCIDRAEILLE